jgi:GDPmannose 4,6-dehydratase
MDMEQQQKTALIIGINGQDGSLMCDILLSKNYIVHGIIRRASNFNTGHLTHVLDKIHLHYGDVTDCMNIFSIISETKPSEIYNFAAQSHVKVSSELENYTFQVNTLGILNILQSVKKLGMGKTCKIYQASTSEIYGNTTNGDILLNEESLQSPCSIYGISKYAAQQVCNLYRDAYGMFVVNSLLFNHEGPRRGPTFVTQKIANHVAKLQHQLKYYDPHYVKDKPKSLKLGNLNARRDWGSAQLYCQVIHKTLQQDTPRNYVIATGETHSVREFTELSFKEIGIELKWIGKGLDEKGIDSRTSETLVEIDPRYFRDIDINCLIGDASKAKRELNWEYTMTFKDLVKEMVNAAKTRLDPTKY